MPLPLFNLLITRGHLSQIKKGSAYSRNISRPLALADDSPFPESSLRNLFYRDSFLPRHFLLFSIDTSKGMSIRFDSPDSLVVMSC